MSVYLQKSTLIRTYIQERNNLFGLFVDLESIVIYFVGSLAILLLGQERPGNYQLCLGAVFSA